MEALTLVLGMMIRLALPVGLLLWVSGQLRAWDARRAI